MFKRTLTALTFAAATLFAGSAFAQVDPNGGAGQGPGGFQIDPAMMEQIQQMQALGEQIQTNMQNAGVDPQEFFQQQFQNIPQDGSVDPATMMQSMQKSMVDKGFMTADQANQMTTVMTNLQQQFQNNPQAQAFRQNMILNNIRQALAVAADDEWNVLVPKVQRILTDLGDVAQNNPTGVSTGLIGGNAAGFGRAQPAAAAAQPAAAAPAANAQERPIDKAWRELCDAVDDPQRSDTDVAARLVSWRQLHQHAQDDLVAAREDLIKYMTLRQEAVMLFMGVL